MGGSDRSEVAGFLLFSKKNNNSLCLKTHPSTSCPSPSPAKLLTFFLKQLHSPCFPLKRCILRTRDEIPEGKILDLILPKLELYRPV